MRTTIEISDELRRKLATEAAHRNMKGFSKIIEEALEKYFEIEIRKEREKQIQELQGSWSEAEYQEVKKQIQEGRKNWRT